MNTQLRALCIGALEAAALLALALLSLACFLGRQTEGGPANALGARGAAVFNTGDGKLLKLQCLRHYRAHGGQVIDVVSYPARIDLLAVYARILERLGAGLGDEIEDVVIPKLTPLRQPHPDDSDFVSNTLCHLFYLLTSNVW